MSEINEKMWGGGFEQQTNPLVEQFGSSVAFDQRLYEFDINCSIAHVKTLNKAQIVNQQETSKIITALEEIKQQMAAGKFNWQIEHEDVHMNIEAALTAKLGSLGKKLHTGRSRNDQIATDLRLYLRVQIDKIQQLISDTQNSLLELAGKHVTSIMPGLTHLQNAQPVSLAHHLLAWWNMLERDSQRMEDCRKRVNESPMGAAALAGTSYDLDRFYSAKLLNFTRPMSNSIDAVSARDFAIEFCAAAAILMIHLSRWSEELILWQSQNFAFIKLPDEFCTGSSLMPQKKNPDIPELVRGKSGRVVGNLNALLVLMKAQALAYNKDNQEDKEAVFDSVDTLKQCLKIYSLMIPNIQVNVPQLRQAALQGYVTATDFADYLVKKGVSFRSAHAATGKLVQSAMAKSMPLEDMSLEELKTAHPAVEDDVINAIKLENVLNARTTYGGTAPQQVRSALSAAQKTMQAKKH